VTKKKETPMPSQNNGHPPAHQQDLDMMSTPPGSADFGNKAGAQAQSDSAGSKQNRRGSGSEHELMRSLMRELFQTEESARSHPRAEAKRLQGMPPARALESVSRHADAVLSELPGRAKLHHLPVSAAGIALGSTFSTIRRYVTDPLMDSESSYRATLLGMRHGLDVMAALREAATAAQEDELADWSERIFQARKPLVEECAHQLTWFARNPDQALRSSLALALKKNETLARGVEAVKAQLGKIQQAISTRISGRTA
jgi:hypothetical protein